MPSSYSTNVRFELQFTGENLNTWGEKLSYTLARVDDAVAGYVAIAITGNYTVQSANSNTTADEARRAVLKFTGTLSATATITIPAVSKVYWIWNACTGGSITITTGSGSTVTISAGDICQVFCDGTNVKTVTISAYGIKDYVDNVAWTYNAGALPSQTGNAGKFVTTNGTAASWAAIATTDISDYATNIKGLAVAMAAAL